MAGTPGAVDFGRRVDDAVLVLFALVAEGVGWATRALLDDDPERASRVIEDDQGIDERCAELVGLVKARLLDTPLGRDELEDLVAVLQIVPELERSADLAEHIAQRGLRSLGATISPRSRGLIQQMGDLAVKMWRDAASAYRQRSRDASFQLHDADDEMDDLAAALVAESAGGSNDGPAAVELALLARFYERLGDHAVNLARRVDEMAAPRRLAAPRAGAPSRRAAQPHSEKRGLVRRLLRRAGNLRLVPSDEGFAALFEEAAENARDCADALAKLVATADGTGEQFEDIKSLERRGDQLTVDLLRRLDASFVTPYDREDIHALTEELDDVVDEMFAAASMIQLVRPDRPLPELPEVVETLCDMAAEMVALIRGMRAREGVRMRLERIEHLERQGDAIYRRGMARLFSGEYEALDVIKWKDVIEAIEGAMNAIEDVSDVVESILVKES